MEDEAGAEPFFRFAEIHDFGPEGCGLLVAVHDRDFSVGICEI